MEKMSIKQFIIRLLLYVLFGGIIPFVYLVWRFKLFQSVSAIAIGGWGLVALIFISVFFLRTLKKIRAGMVFSAATKTIDAITKLFIPLLIAIMCVYFAGTVQQQLIEFLIVVFVSNIPAAIINPIPRWSYENKIEQTEAISNFLSLAKQYISDKGEPKK